MLLVALSLFVFLSTATAQQPWVPAPQTPQSWFPYPDWWNDRFQTNVNNSLVNGGNINILFFGDSITDGWMNIGRQTWDQAFSPLWASNYAIPGDGVQHVLWRIINGEVQNISPRLIILKVGTNNAYMPMPEVDVARGVEAVVTELRARLPSSRILLLGILPRHDAQTTDYIERINAMIAHNDNGNTVRYLNMRNQFFNNATGQLQYELYDPDRIHLVAAGYVRWYETMSSLFDEMWHSP